MQDIHSGRQNKYPNDENYETGAWDPFGRIGTLAYNSYLNKYYLEGLTILEDSSPRTPPDS
jgi:hypothetical protein